MFLHSSIQAAHALEMDILLALEIKLFAMRSPLLDCFVKCRHSVTARCKNPRSQTRALRSNIVIASALTDNFLVINFLSTYDVQTDQAFETVDISTRAISLKPKPLNRPFSFIKLNQLTKAFFTSSKVLENIILVMIDLHFILI